MKRLIGILDFIAFIFFGIFFGLCVFILLIGSLCIKKRRRKTDEINKFSFPVYDLISNKYSSMFEDALLNGYFSKDYYLYLDFTNRIDRFENIQDKIFFYSIAAHPDNALYNTGFRKMSMLFVEIKILLRSFSIVRRADISLIKAHDPHILGLNGLLLSRFFRVPYIIHLNSDFDMKYKGTGTISTPFFISRSAERLFESFIMSFADLIIADRKSYRDSKNFPKNCLERYRAIGVRVDRTHYRGMNARQSLKDELGLAGKKILLYVGRLHPVKYPEDAIRALRLIKKVIDNAALVVVGSGILRAHLEDMVRREGLEGSVFFLGPKKYEELIDIFYTADVLLAPHGGVTLVEAALASTPIVAYDFDWHPEFLEDGRMGYMVQFRDVEGMARKALEILKDEALRNKMGSYCREIALSRYSREISVENERRIYDELLKI